MVWLTLLATGSIFRLVLVPGFPYGIIQVPGNKIPDSLNRIVSFPVTPGIGSSSTLDFGSLDKMEITYSEPKYYLGRSGKGLITSLGLRTIIRSKKDKKASYAITDVSLKGLSDNIKGFEDFTYEGYVWKRSKYVPTDSYSYLSRHLDKCMMRFNMHVGPVRTQMTNMQKMNNYETCPQNMNNFQVYSLYESE